MSQHPKSTQPWSQSQPSIQPPWQQKGPLPQNSQTSHVPVYGGSADQQTSQQFFSSTGSQQQNWTQSSGVDQQNSSSTPPWQNHPQPTMHPPSTTLAKNSAPWNSGTSQQTTQAPWQQGPSSVQPASGGLWQPQPVPYSAAAPGKAQPPEQQPMRTWIGRVTALIPPNYGVVDGDSFYASQVVNGQLPKVGDQVACMAIPNSDGDNYAWCIMRAEVVQEQVTQAGQPGQPAQADQAGQPTGQPSQPMAAQTQAAQPGQPGQAGQPMVAQGPGTFYPANVYTQAPPPKARLKFSDAVAVPSQETDFPKLQLQGSGSSVQLESKPASKGTGKASGSGGYNIAPPPITHYSTEAALAVAVNAVTGSTDQVTTTPKSLTPGALQAVGVATDQNALARRLSAAGSTAVEFDDDARKRSEAAIQALMKRGDPSGIGARMLQKMGYGAMEGSKGGLGKAEAGIAVPLDPQSNKAGLGLGFLQTAPPVRERERPRGRDRDRGRVRTRRRSRSRSSSRSRSRSRTPSRSRSPVRYSVRVPRFPTFERHRGVPSLSKRYRNLHIPSDVCSVECSWLDSCPDHNPLLLTHPVRFDICPFEESTASNERTKMSEERHSGGALIGESIDGVQAAVEAGEGGGKDAEGVEKLADGDKGFSTGASTGDSTLEAIPLSVEDIASGRRWLSKVVLMSGMDSRVMNATDLMFHKHPLKKMQMLMGKRGRGEFMLVGGKWEPRDGGHPQRDHTALINTAIRTFKAATGVDLSSCTQWTKFCEFQYIRCDKHSVVRYDHCVVWLVDSWLLANSDNEALQAVRDAHNAIGAEETARQVMVAAQETVRKAKEDLRSAEAELPTQCTGPRPPDLKMDPRSMNVLQLQEELNKRGLDTRWNPLKGKQELVDRLQVGGGRASGAGERKEVVALKLQTEEQGGGECFQAVDTAKAARKTAEEGAKLINDAARDARDASCRAARLLVDPPPTDVIRVVPNKTFYDRHGRFSLAALSLEDLLNYRDWPKSELCFEVAVFGELFHEMLETRFGRGIARTLEYWREHDGDFARSAVRPPEPATHPLVSLVLQKLRERMDLTVSESITSGTGGGVVDTGPTSDKDGNAEDGNAAALDQEHAPAVADTTGDKDEENAVSSKKRSLENEELPDDKRRKSGSPGAASVGGLRSTFPQKAVTFGPDSVQLCCRFFDRNFRGYITADDLQEILYMTCDTMSRRRVQQLVDVVSQRSKMSYEEYSGQYAPAAFVDGPSEWLAVGTADAGVAMCSTGGPMIDVKLLQNKLRAGEVERKVLEQEVNTLRLTSSETCSEAAVLRDNCTALANDLRRCQAELEKLKQSSGTRDEATTKGLEALQCAQQWMRQGMSALLNINAALEEEPAKDTLPKPKPTAK